MNKFKPMLAATAEISDIKYPVYASPKLDGIRGVVINGQLRSRSLKPVPNAHVTGLFSKKEFSGLDGELILGKPTAKDVYRVTNAACSRHEGTPDVKFYVFDRFNINAGFEIRNEGLKVFKGDSNIVIVEQQLFENPEDLLDYETACLDLGFEGLILRSPYGLYKFGRSTLKQQGMMKLKRFIDSEAKILEVIEEMENQNESKTNELGRTSRSSHAANLVPKGRAGALRVVDIRSNVEFKIGTGLNDEDKVFYWKKRKAVIGKIVKYKSFPIGVKDAPRHPVYLGGREEWDL